MLSPFGVELWTAQGPTVSFYGFPYPTRMAVARLPGRRLWLWSPIRADAEILDALAELGEVSFLVAPNKLHHLFLGDWLEHFPAARLYASPGLMKKRPDLSFTAELDNHAPAEWLKLIRSALQWI